MSEYEEDDGLSSFNLRQLGGKVGAFGGAKLLKFVQGDFITREGEKIEPEREFITFGLTKAVQKFVNKQLVDTIVVEPHADFPDIKAMNEAAPQEEWGIGLDGRPQGPYTHVLILKFLDVETFNRYAFITNSMGGGVAVGDLTDKCKIARRIHGPNVTAVVTCHSTRWQTKFNPHGKRPDFRIKRWMPLDGDGGKRLVMPTEALKSITPPPPATEPMTSAPVADAAPPTAPASAPQTETVPPVAPASVTPTAPVPPTPGATLSTIGPAGLSLKTVPAPTRAQELDDQVPFNASNKG